LVFVPFILAVSFMMSGFVLQVFARPICCTYKLLQAREPTCILSISMRSEEGHLILVLVNDGHIHFQPVVYTFSGDQSPDFTIDACAATLIELAALVLPGRDLARFSLDHHCKLI
jgi:hypothetical protein